MSQPRPSPPADRDRVELSLHNESAAIRQAEQGFLAAIERHQFPPAAVFALRLALEEAVANAFRHGHKNIPEVPIRVKWEVDDRRVALEVEDCGPGFQPDSVPDPTAPDRLEVPSGRGLMLMRAYMTSVEYNAKGNCVRMLFERP